MSQSHAKTIARIYESWARGNLRDGAAELDRHVVFVVRPPFPEFTAVVGPSLVSDYMRRFLRGWRVYTIEAKRLRVVGDTVLATAVQRGDGKSSGAEVETEFFMLFTFRGDKIIRIESVLDEDEALEAVGLSRFAGSASPCAMPQRHKPSATNARNRHGS